MTKITSKHLEVTPLIRERIQARLDKLSRHDIQLINPHIIITQEKQLFRLDATVTIPGNQLIAQAKSEDIYHAINSMGQKLEKQLNRVAHKDEAQRYNKVRAEDETSDLELDYQQEVLA